MHASQQDVRPKCPTRQPQKAAETRATEENSCLNWSGGDAAKQDDKPKQRCPSAEAARTFTEYSQYDSEDCQAAS